MKKFRVQLSGKRNGLFCAVFLTIKAENAESASEKAINKTDLLEPKVYQALQLSKNYNHAPF